MSDSNPVIAEVTRGRTVESRHRGAFAVCTADGRVIASAGNIDMPVFPRSAVKAFQCVPVIESGAADHFGFTDEEIALCCASHNGEEAHVRVAAAMLAKAGNHEADYECGAHWPENLQAHHALVRAGASPRDIHNNCSGKHAGMLALARHLGVGTQGYVSQSHAVQQAVASVLARFTGVDVAQAPMGIDGCSVPTWAVPLRNLAQAFARLAAPDCAAGQRIIAAVRAHPLMVAGTGEFDTRVMQAVPRLFIKIGAEGVYCGCIAHAGLGFALKVDDGAKRGAIAAVVALLLSHDVWTAEERAALQGFRETPLENRRHLRVGEVRPAT